GVTFVAPLLSWAPPPGWGAVPVQLPIGQEENFRGVVDLIEMRSLTWSDDLGTNTEIGEVPAELVEQANEYHHQLIEAVADHDEELLETYLEDERALPPEMRRPRARHPRDDAAGASRGDARHQRHSGAARLRFQEQGRAAAARRRRRLSA